MRWTGIWAATIHHNQKTWNFVTRQGHSKRWALKDVESSKQGYFKRLSNKEVKHVEQWSQG
jgi:hypothetical protein